MPYKLLEAVTKDENHLLIPYHKYQLDNGLTVIIHQDTTNPLVHIDVTYHVGSARESLGKSGFAHFFEHMMFEGSKHVGNNEHFKIISEAGGTLNGTTNRDRTNYFETVPKNQLETVLWLESDRMGYLLEAVTLEKFENQRSVIKNEKAQRYENQPYGMLGQVSQEGLYHAKHPYSWTTIGYTEDLDRVTIEDLKAFFLEWYGANNATLTIGGDVDIEETMQLIEKYFGGIPKGKEVLKAEPQPVVLSEKRYVSYQDKVHFPMIQITYPTVPFFHEDEAALDVLADIIGNGKNSFFYANFEKQHKAVQSYCSHYCSELAGEFKLGVFAYSGIKLGECELEINAILRHIANEGISEHAVERSKQKYYADLLYGLESVKNRVSKLAMYQTFLSDANFIADDAKRYKELTAAKVFEVFHKYIFNKKPLVVSFYNKGEESLLPASDNFTFQRVQPKELEHVEQVSIPIKINTFDRSIKPNPGFPPLVSMPEFYREKLPNGCNIIGTFQPDSPKVSMMLSFEAGSISDTSNTCGRAAFFAEMFKESTHNLSSEEVDDRLETLAAQINTHVDKEKFQIEVRCLRENMDATLALVADLMQNPAYKNEDVERVRREYTEMLTFQNTQPEVMANRNFNRLLYGPKSPLSRPGSGTIESINNLQVADLKEFAQEWLQPQNATLVVSGACSEEEVKKYWSFFLEKKAGEPKQPNIGTLTFDNANKIFLVHKEGAAQSEIRVGYPSLTYDATGVFYKCKLMNFVLGDAFNSRINLNLREDKGFTYGARSYFAGTKLSGAFVVQAAVGSTVTAEALHEIYQELERYQKFGPTEQEWEFTQKSILYRDALKYETNRQKISFLRRLVNFDLHPEYVKIQQDILLNTPVDEIRSLSNSYIKPDQLMVVIVGDKNVVLEPLQNLKRGEIILIEPEIEVIA